MSLLVLSMSTHSSFTACAQDKPIPLQHIVFKNKVVADNLTASLATTNAQIAYVHVSMKKSGYSRPEDTFVYRIEDAAPYVDYIEDFREPLWAIWQGRIILLRPADTIDPDQVYTITDKTGYSNLVKYARCVLPRIVVKPVTIDKKTGEKTALIKYDIFDGVFWEFKVVKGKAVFLNGANMTEDIIDIPAPESESNTKPIKP